MKFSQNEFYFLFSQFAPVAALGWENPYTGWLAEEIEAAQKEALKSLIDRDLVRMIEKNEIALAENIASIFNASARPEFSLIIVSTKNGKSPQQQMIHCKEGLIVQHSIKKESHSLAVFESWPDLLSSLTPLLMLKAPAKGSIGPFEVSEDAFAACEDLIKKKETRAAKSLLKDEKLDAKTSDALLEGLSKPSHRSAVIVVPSKNSKVSLIKSGLAVYQSEKQMWLLRPFERAGKQFIEFLPGDSDLVKKEFNQLLPLRG